MELCSLSLFLVVSWWLAVFVWAVSSSRWRDRDTSSQQFLFIWYISLLLLLLLWWWWWLQFLWRRSCRLGYSSYQNGREDPWRHSIDPSASWPPYRSQFDVIISFFEVCRGLLSVALVEFTEAVDCRHDDKCCNINQRRGAIRREKERALYTTGRAEQKERENMEMQFRSWTGHYRADQRWRPSTSQTCAR